MAPKSGNVRGHAAKEKVASQTRKAKNKRTETDDGEEKAPKKARRMTAKGHAQKAKEANNTIEKLEAKLEEARLKKSEHERLAAEKTEALKNNKVAPATAASVANSDSSYKTYLKKLNMLMKQAKSDGFDLDALVNDAVRQSS
jgi:flagellar biosynthesis GTPase FlhF